ncbi:MAG: HAD family hydrolase [Myxococcales bacterium]|jgi:FMN phosphatase YigB (HAD superfamily)|nr:HAD family hydrolase [Myxococcales bacterium]
MNHAAASGAIRGVIFDLDGTLYTLPALKLRIAFRLWRSLGFLRRLSTARNAVRSQNFDSPAALLGAFYDQLALATGHTAAEAEQWFQREFSGAFVQTLKAHARLRQGVPQMLHALRQNGVRTAVLSDYAWVKERLGAIGIDFCLFDTIASTEDFGALKPSPVAFRQLATNWHLPAEQVLVVGDRLDMDRAAADTAGMPFWDITAPKGNARMWQQVLDLTAVATDTE